MKNFTRSVIVLVSFVFFGLTDISAQPKAVRKVSDDLSSVQQTAARKAPLIRGLQQNDLILRGPDGNSVLIEALSDGNTKQLLDDLSVLGLKGAVAYGKKVNGYLPVKAISDLETIKNLVHVEPVYKPAMNAGPAYTNGDIALRSNVARTKWGLDGRGIKIGVLSDSYNSLGGAQEGVLSGELPGTGNPNGYVQDVTVLDDVEDASDEGRAMVEIVHDVAPAAKIMFNTAYKGTAAFAQGIRTLADSGCNVITDDIYYYTEPFFQDGIVAQAVDEVAKKGTAYYSSAGNAERNSYSSKFRNGGIHTIVNPYKGYEVGQYAMHDFDPGPGVDLFQTILLSPGDNFTISFQWDDPFASACEDCPGASSDLDVFLSLSKDTADVIFESLNSNVDGEPVEILSITYNGDELLPVYISFGRWIDAPGKNPDPGYVQYINFGSALIGEYITNSPTTRGHSNTKHGVGVGAAAWFNTPAFGDDTALINYFSSAGGIPILFDTKGRRLRKPEYRMSPLFTATDGGNTSFFGQQLNDGDKYPNFFGTSAAAPHAAAVTAQLLQMSDNRVSARSINQILSYTALDMDDPFTDGFDRGYDKMTGYGLIQADKAASQLLKQVGVRYIFACATCSQKPDSSRNWKIYNPNPFSLQVIWELLGTNQKDTLFAAPGNNYLETETSRGFNLLAIKYYDQWGLPIRNIAFSPGFACSRTKSGDNEGNAAVADEPSLVISAHPNPVKSHLTLELYNGKQESVVAKVYSLTGAEVYTEIIDPVYGYSSNELNLSKIPSGMYILKLITPNGQLGDAIKLLKE